MKKRAAFLLILPAFGALLAGCTIPEPVKNGLRTVKNGVKDGVNKAVDAMDNFFSDSDSKKEEETDKKVEYRVEL